MHALSSTESVVCRGVTSFQVLFVIILLMIISYGLDSNSNTLLVDSVFYMCQLIILKFLVCPLLFRPRHTRWWLIKTTSYWPRCAHGKTVYSWPISDLPRSSTGDSTEQVTESALQCAIYLSSFVTDIVSVTVEEPPLPGSIIVYRTLSWVTNMWHI